MTSIHRIAFHGRVLFAKRARMLGTSVLVICAMSLLGSLWGQTFSGCTGSPGNTCAPSNAVVGIGTQNPNSLASLSVTGRTFLSAGPSATWMWSDGGTYFQLGA